MPTHNPIGSCCTRPRLNEVGGIDDHGTPDNTLAIPVIGILAALAVVYAGALLLHSN